MSKRFPTVSRRATIRDVAAKAGVSTATVSKFVNRGDYYIAEETKARIAAAIEELEYEPSAAARGLVQRRSNTIGVVIASYNNPFYAALVSGVDDVIGATDFTMIVASNSDSERDSAAVIGAMRQRQVEGLLLASGVDEVPEITRALRAGIEVVMASRDTPNLDVDVVESDDEAGARNAVEHLFRHGHTRIAHLAGPQGPSTFVKRLHGFRSGCAAVGIEVSEELIPIATVATLESGEALAEQLLQRDDRPTAIFAANDQMALGVLKAAHRLNVRVPEDIALIGFDNVWVSDLPGVGLSSVDTSTRELGRIAARRLLERIENRWASTASAPVSMVQTVSTRLIPRRTCGCSS